jgi:hypothetical protein
MLVPYFLREVTGQEISDGNGLGRHLGRPGGCDIRELGVMAGDVYNPPEDSFLLSQVVRTPQRCYHAVFPTSSRQ